MAAEMAEYEGVTPEILRLKLATKSVGQQLIAMNVLKGASSLSNFKNDRPNVLTSQMQVTAKRKTKRASLPMNLKMTGS